MCVNKRLITNKKYTATKKNGGTIPVLKDPRQKNIWVPCGQCYLCKRKKAREWRMRIAEDIKVNKIAKIITLTFNTESLRKLTEECKGYTGYNLDNAICKLAVKRWRERWRKKYGRSIRHWLITELGHGKTEHVHMHGIIWQDERYQLEDTLINEAEKTWGYGFIGKGKINWQTGEYINYVNEKTATYFTKYVTKIDEQHKEYKQIILSSAGIGKAFLESDKAKDNVYNGENTKQQYNIDNGGVLPMPEYFRRKMYSDEEREQLTTQYLNKGIQYIEGVEYPSNLNDSNVNRIMNELREKNRRLGYGDGTKNYERKRMENARRRKIQAERLKTGNAPRGTSSRLGIAPEGAESINDALKGAIKPNENW